MKKEGNGDYGVSISEPIGVADFKRDGGLVLVRLVAKRGTTYPMTVRVKIDPAGTVQDPNVPSGLEISHSGAGKWCGRVAVPSVMPSTTYVVGAWAKFGLTDHDHAQQDFTTAAMGSMEIGNCP